MDFCKIVNDEEFGQILAVRSNDDDNDAPSIQVTISPKHEGIEFLSTEFTYDDTDEGRAKRDEIWQKEYMSGDDTMINIAWTLNKQLEEMFEGI